MLPADAAHVRTGMKESGRLCKLSLTPATVYMLVFEHAPVSNWMCTALHGFADVVIEFGHNDGGTPATSDRAPLSGTGDTSEVVTRLDDGTSETVYTWPASVSQVHFH
jgi:hypothetical protein